MTKVKIDRDWFKASEKPEEKRIEDLFEQATIVRTEDLPTWLSAEQAAPYLFVEPKTAWSLMKSQVVKSVKLRGKRVTTAEWIADFIKREMKAHG